MARAETHSIKNVANSANTSIHQISSRCPDPLECMASHLLLECSEVLAGIKPANLISLVNRPRSCGRNLYQLWDTYHGELTDRLAKICFKVLKTSDRARLLFCYNPEHLDHHLPHSGIRAILAKTGYDTSQGSTALVSELCNRIKKSDVFPHEIGLFIGYPAKDVAAFMGMINLPFTCQGPWKIYGEPGQSLYLADSFRRSRQDMGRQLARCVSPFDCLNRSEENRAFFFHKRDNNIQYSVINNLDHGSNRKIFVD